MTRLPGRLGLFAAGLLAVAACDRAPEPAASEPPWKETPYKADFEGENADLLKEANAYHLPEYAQSGRLPVRGDVRCVIRRARLFEADGEHYGLVAIFASQDEDCGGVGAVLLSLSTLDRRDAADGEALGRQVVEVGGSREAFTGQMLNAGYLGGGRPPKAFIRASNEKNADELLRRLVAIQPITADRLPAWPEGELQPVLPAKVPDEITFEPFADRQTYEAARRGRKIALCWKHDSGTVLRCMVEAERRRPSQILLFAAHGWGAFSNADDRRALEMVIGQPIPVAK